MSVLPDGYEAVIGLEIHVQLSTRTKMFCGCELSFGDDPNVHTCPVCLAHPGSLPVINEQAVRYGIQIGLALGCEIAPRSIFHRKNYFYPDNPKAYQISQYDIPLATNGRLGDVRIHRVHLEEDAAKLVHLGESGRIHGSGHSLVDFNRGGTPLVEIVTEPDLRDPAAAREWLQLLRTTIKALGVSDVNMEEGSLRCDANVSIRPAGAEELGVKTELKNMNSFRFIERGIEAELARQLELAESGEGVTQETLSPASRSWLIVPIRPPRFATLKPAMMSSWMWIASAGCSPRVVSPAHAAGWPKPTTRSSHTEVTVPTPAMVTSLYAIEAARLPPATMSSTVATSSAARPTAYAERGSQVRSPARSAAGRGAGRPRPRRRSVSAAGRTRGPPARG